jgi:hypothetical protein
MNIKVVGICSYHWDLKGYEWIRNREVNKGENETLCNSHSSNIIGINKYRRMRWMGNVARTRDSINTYILFVDLNADGRIILKLVLNKQAVTTLTVSPISG